jgi:hypothetical protein
MTSSDEDRIIDLGLLGVGPTVPPVESGGAPDRSGPSGPGGSSDAPGGSSDGPGGPSEQVGRAAREGAAVIEAGPAGRARARGSRGMVGLVALAVLAAAAVGFVAGLRRGADGGAAPAPAASVTPDGVPPMVATGDVCAVQLGDRLQLGAEVANRSGLPVTLGEIEAIFPLPGLRATASGWGACGELPRAVPQTSAWLPPGAAVWINITVDVLVPCPAPIPVGFVLAYTEAGQSGSVQLPAFPDLGGVPYTGCPASPS